MYSRFYSDIVRMVLAQPQNQSVVKAFGLTGKVAIVTGKRNVRTAMNATDKCS